MLYRADRMECLDTSWIVIRNTAGSVVPTREILAASFRLKSTGDTVVICANHWTSKYGGALETEENRLLQARALGTYVDRLLHPLTNETHTSDRDRQQSLTNERHTSIRDRQQPLTNETHTSDRDRQRPLTNETHSSIRDRQRLQEKDTIRLVQLQVPEKDTSGLPEPQAPDKHVHGLHQISVIAGGDMNDLPGSVPLQLLIDTFQLQAVLPGMYHGPAGGTGVPSAGGPGYPAATGPGVPTAAGKRFRRPFLSGNSSSPGTVSTPVSTYKYQGNWGSIDHVFVGGRLRAEDCRCFVFRHPLLLEDDAKHTGKKPYRTYTGFSYHGGVSDHLPLLLHFVVPGD
jgi:hypothetical protein